MSQASKFCSEGGNGMGGYDLNVLNGLNHLNYLRPNSGISGL